MFASFERALLKAGRLREQHGKLFSEPAFRAKLLSGEFGFSANEATRSAVPPFFRYSLSQVSGAFPSKGQFLFSDVATLGGL